MKNNRQVFIPFVCFLAIFLVFHCSYAATPTEKDIAKVVDVFGGKLSADSPAYDGYVLSSQYVKADDGIELAADIYLPEDLPVSERIPAIVLFTRYWRRWEMLPPLGSFIAQKSVRDFFPDHGYALVVVDVRGSGTSFGTRVGPWTARERQDYGNVFDWIVQQPWSNGRVGTSGVSYVGTAAEFAGLIDHPAVKASLPRFSLYDVYTDILSPGGVLNKWFVFNWGLLNWRLDAGQPPESMSSLVRFLVRGPYPVKEGRAGRKKMAQALEGHNENGDLMALAQSIVYRDDIANGTSVTADDLSPHMFCNEKGAPTYGWAGWYDGAYADAALRRYMSCPVNDRLVIGPWNHAATKYVSPLDNVVKGPDLKQFVRFLEQKRYLDYYLKGKGRKPETGIFYYTYGSEKWQRTESWPPEYVHRENFYMTASGHLQPVNLKDENMVEYRVDYSTGTGEKNRWRTQLGRTEVRYPNRNATDLNLLVFQTDPLRKPLEITGTPFVSLKMSSSVPDAAVFAYLEAVAPDGNVRYLTEGMLRLIHRQETTPLPHSPAVPAHGFKREQGRGMVPEEFAMVRFGLLPLSVEVPAGYSLRVAIAGHDESQFAQIPAVTPDEGVRFRVVAGGEDGSFLSLPVR